MQDNIKDLHSALISDGHYSEADLGNEQEFRDYISKPENAKAFHQAIISDGHYSEADLGNADEFANYVGIGNLGKNAEGVQSQGGMRTLTKQDTLDWDEGIIGRGTLTKQDTLDWIARQHALDKAAGIPEQNYEALRPWSPDMEQEIGAPKKPGLFGKMKAGAEGMYNGIKQTITGGMAASHNYMQSAREDFLRRRDQENAVQNENILSAEEEQQMRDNYERTGQYFPEEDNKPSPFMPQDKKSELDKTWEERMNESTASQWSKEQILKMRDEEKEAQEREAMMNSIAVPASTFTPEARQNAYEQWKQALKAQNPDADVDAWIKDNGYDQPQQMQQIADAYLSEQYQQANQYVGRTWKQVYDEPMQAFRDALTQGKEAGRAAADKALEKAGGMMTQGNAIWSASQGTKAYNKYADNEKAVSAAIERAHQVAQMYGLDKTQFSQQIIGQAYDELIKSKMPQSAAENILIGGLNQSVIGQAISYAYKSDFDRMLEAAAQNQYDQNVGLGESVLKGIATFAADSWMYLGTGGTAGALASGGVKKMIGKHIADKLVKGGMSRELASATAQRVLTMMPSTGSKMMMGGAHGAATFGAIGAAEGAMQGAIDPGQMRNTEAGGQKYEDINPADYRLQYQAADEQARSMMMTPEEQEEAFNAAKGTKSKNAAIKGGIFGTAGGALFQGAPIADVIFRGTRGVVGAMGRSLTQAGINTGAMTAQQTAEMAYEGGEAWEQFDVQKAAAQNFGTILGLEARSIYNNVRNFRQMDNYNERLSNLNRELKASPYKNLTDAIAKLGMNVSGAYDVEGKGMKTVEGKHSGFSAEQVKDIQENAYKAIASGALTQEGANTLMSLLTGQGINVNPTTQVNVEAKENNGWTVSEYDAAGDVVRTRQFKTEGQALAYQMKVQHAADVETAGVLEAAVNQANALENARAFVDQAYNGGVAEKVEQYNAVRDKYNQWFAVKEKSDRGGYLTREEEMLLKNPPAFTAEEQSIIDNAPTDMERDIVDAYNLQQGGNATGPGVAAYRNIISKMVGDSNYSAEFASNYEAENGLEPNSVLNAYRPLTAEERDAWVEAHPDGGAPHKYGDGFSTPEMDNIRKGYENAMKDYVKNARSTYEGGTAGGNGDATEPIQTAGLIGNVMERPSGEAEETDATEGVGTPVAEGEGAKGLGKNAEGMQNLTPQQKAQEEAKQKAQMAQMRGNQIVANDGQGASELSMEHETAKARVARAFTEGSQNAQIAADVMNMVDTGRAQTAYSYLNEKRGELTEAQSSALEQYIGAQTSVNAMQESIANIIRAQVTAQVTAHDNTMTQLIGEDGQLTRVQVMPMGNQQGAQTAYVKSGSLTNKYGGPIQVTYVTEDENGEPVIGNTTQIARSRVAPNSAVTEGYDEHMAQYEQSVTENTTALWERRSQGLDYQAGDVLPIRMGGGYTDTIIIGSDDAGNIVYGDPEDPNNRLLWQTQPRAEFDQAVADGRQNAIHETLSAEASERIQQTKRANAAAKDAKRRADIVGYDMGAVDLTHKDTKTRTAAEYLVEVEAGNEGAVNWIETQKATLVRQQEQLIEEQRKEAQWIGAYGGLDDPEEQRHQDRLQNLNEQLEEIDRQYNKLNEIKTYAMSKEQREELARQRGQEIVDAEGRAAKKYKAEKQAVNTRGLPTDREGEVRIGLVDGKAAERFIMDNYKGMMDADEFLRQQFSVIDDEGRRLRSIIDSNQQKLNAYRDGRIDLTAEEIDQYAGAAWRAQKKMDDLLLERTAVNKLNQKLEKMYEERNALEWAEDPEKGRIERINRKRTPEAKLKQALTEYRDYPEAMTVLEQGLEPQTLEEYVSGIGAGTLSWEGYGVGEHHVRGLQEEIGRNMTRSRFAKRGDTYAFDYMLARKAQDGMGIDELSHKMAEDTQWTPEEVKQAIIDMLMSARTPDDIKNRIINNRLEEAESAARYQDEREADAAQEAAWYEQNGLNGQESSGEAEGTVAGAEDPFAEAGVEMYDNYDFSLDSQEIIDKHNERAKQDGGLISNDGSKSLTLGMASLLDRVGNQVGRTIKVQSADEIWNNLSPAQQKKFGSKEALKRLGVGYNDPVHNQLVINGAYLVSKNDPAEIVRVVLGHELTHIIKAMNSPEVWNTYVELVKNALGENVFKHNLNLVRRRYEGMPGYTGADKEQKFIEEVCANFAGDNKFTSDKDIQKLVDAMDKNDVDMSAFTDTIRRILDMLKDLEDMANEMKDVGLISDYDSEDIKDVKQEALDTWDQMYKTAVEKVEAKRASVAEDGGADFMLVTDPNEIKAFDDAPKRMQYRSMQLIDGKLYPPMATVIGKGKDKKRQDGLSIGDLFKADENPQLAKPIIDKTTGEQKINAETGRPQYTFNLDKGGKDDFGEKLTSVDAAYNPYVHSSNSPINDQFATAYKRSNLVTVKGEISEDDINSGYWAEKAHDSVGEKDWKLGVTSTALEKAGKVARKVTLSQYFRPTEIVPTEDVAKYYAEQLKGTDITIPFNTVGPKLREALVKLGVTISEPENSNAGKASMPAYEAWKAASVKEPSGEAEGTGAVGAAEAPLTNKWRVDNELAGKEVKIAKGDRNHGFATNKDASDWAKTNIAKTYNNEETGGKGTIRVSNASIQKFLSGKAFAQSSDRDSHLAALKAMPELLKTSIDVEQHPDRRKNEKGERDEAAGINPNIVIHRLYGALDLDGQLYRVKITLKENTQTREATKAYSYETTKIELLDGQSEDVTKTPSRNSNNSISAAKLLKNIKSSYNKGKYLLDESEKLTESRLNGAQNGENVQENNEGEPIELNLNGDVYKVSDIEEKVLEDVKRIIQENDLDAEIVGVKVIGSYMRAEAEKRYEDLRRERERFVKLFGEMPESSGEAEGTVAELVSGGRYVDVSGIKPEEATEGVGTPVAEGTVAADWDAQIKAAREAVNGNPTDGQKEAGNYKKGHLRLDGFNISIENAKGSTRSGRDADGKEWSVTMNYDYGDIRGRVGVDGDNIDVYLSDKPYEGNVYVVDQVNPKTGEFDEHKVMYGFNSLEEAKEAYLSNYEDDWKGLGNITEVSKPDFKEWLQSSKRKRKPFAEYKRFEKATEGVGTPVAEDAEKGFGKNAEEVQKQVQELERVNKEMTELVKAEAERYIEEQRERDIEEVYGRYPGDPVSLRDRGITLTPIQRKVFAEEVKRCYDILNRQNDLLRTANEPGDSLWKFGWEELGAYPGKAIWFPEDVDDVDHFGMLEDDSFGKNAEEVQTLEQEQGADEAGKPARVDENGQTYLWELGTNAQRPRKKKGESDFAYIARVAAWEMQQQKIAEAPPAPDQEAIDQRWNEQYELDHAAWAERHGIEDEMTSEPKRGDYASVDDYADALREWEKQSAARADADDPEPQAFDYMVKAQDEYRDAYAQWQRDNDIHEEGEGMLSFSTIFTGDAPQPRTVIGTNVETGEQVEMPADEVLAEQIAEDEQIMREIGSTIGFANTPAGVRWAVKIGVIERRKTLESSCAEDAIFLHGLKTDMKNAAKELGMKGEELDKMMPFIIESPTRLAEIVEATYFDMRKHPLDFYTVKSLLPQIFSNEASEEALINDIRDVMNQALEGGGDAELTAAMRHYELYNDERIKPIMDKVGDWYQEFYALLDSKGLRRDAGKVNDYVNHEWSKKLSDPKAYEKYVRTTSKNMKKREITTYAKGIELGLAPKHEKLTEMMAHYSRENNEAIANRELLDYLTGLQMALYNSDGELINNLDVLSSEEPSINKDRYMRYEVPGVGGVWVLKDVQKRFATIFGQEWNLDANEGENQFWRIYDIVASTMKKIQLSMSLFHLGALTEVATVQKNPFLAIADLLKYTFWDSLRAGTTPALAHPEDFKDAAAHLVKLGATDDYAAADLQALTGKLRKLAQEVYDHQKAIGAVPLGAATLLDWINKGMDKLLWEYVHDGLKVAVFRGYAKSIRAKAAKEGWSDIKLDRMLDEAGQYVNDAFGGQYWEVIGVTPATLKTMRRGMMAPDWFISTARHAMSVTGFGSLYSPEGFIDYATMRGKWDKEYEKEYEEIRQAEGDAWIGNEGRKFRAKKAGLCYGLLVPLFYGGIMNALNAAFKKLDEEREKEKAEEIRKTNPDYLSPYERIYPDGMKWYDYTMWGNSMGNRTLLFTGRYEDGTERYARWGKQFRELPEFFMGRYGIEVPGPFLERMLGKINPAAGTMIDIVRYFGAGLLNKTPEQQDLEQKYGKHIGALAMVAKKFLPFSVPTDESKEFYWLDLVMPSKKGFSEWRAVDAYEHFILAGDLDGVRAVTNACIMNGIDPEQKLQAAMKHVEATQRKERATGVTDIGSAMDAFDASTNVKDRQSLKKKIAAYMTGPNYRMYLAADAQQRVENYLNGTDESSAGVTKSNSDRYMLLMTAEDVRDEIIITKANKAAKSIVDTGKEEQANGDNGAYLEAHQREVDVVNIIKKYNSDITKLKKTLGKGNDEAVMEKIRKLRKELIEKVNTAGRGR